MSKVILAQRCVRADCERILRTLPLWFGIEEALLEYANNTSRYPTLVYMDGENIIGFISIRQHFTQSFEIDCVAVDNLHRGQGIGHKLLDEAKRYVCQSGGKLLQVKTLASSHPSPEYAHTRRFYESIGFIPMEVFPTLWSESNPCLQMLCVLQD